MSASTLLERLVAVPTHNPGGDERVLASLTASMLRERGADAVDVHDVPRDGAVGAVVLARWGTPRLLINAHLDTVPPSAGWTTDPFVLRTDGNALVGLGAADTKGGIAAVLTALERTKPRDVGVCFSGDEERTASCIRWLCGGRLVDDVQRAVVCEPTNRRIGTRHRGILGFSVEASGPGGHSSRADDLPAPLTAVARFAVALAEWSDARRAVGPAGFSGMCGNTGLIEGGAGFNVVPTKARLLGSVRPPPGVELAPVQAELAQLAERAGVSLRFTVIHPTFATRAPEDFMSLFPSQTPTADLGFWTEAALFAERGIDAVVYGAGDIAVAHAPDERLDVAELDAAVDTFAKMLAS